MDKNLKHKFIKDEKSFKFSNYKEDGALLLIKTQGFIFIAKLEFDELKLAAIKAYSAVK